MSYEFSPEQLKWIEALESGEYHQTTGCLKRLKGRVVSHCCLGVAMELFDPNDNLMFLDTYTVMNSDGTSEFVGESNGGSLSTSVMNLLRLRSSEGVNKRDETNIDKIILTFSESRALTRLNDEGMSFADIAKLLREKPEEYFLD